VPVTRHQPTVQLPIAIAHHHAVGFDHQHPWRWVMLTCGRFVRLFNGRHRRPLSAFQFCADPFGVGPQRLAAHLDPS